MRLYLSQVHVVAANIVIIITTNTTSIDIN